MTVAGTSPTAPAQRRMLLLSAGSTVLLAACSASTHAAPTPTPHPTAALTPSPTAAPSATATASLPPTSPTPLLLPTGFSPTSVTFVSTSAGWTLGTYPCAASNGCLALLRTSDSGRTWTPVHTPTEQPSHGYEPGVHRVRFADLQDGWLFGPDLWATHDGGVHWQQMRLGDPANNDVQSLETVNGLAHAAVIGSSGMQIFTSSVSNNTWTAWPTTVPIGAGPVPRAQVVLQRTSGWAIENDRTVIGGERYGGAAWKSWQPPCASAGGPAFLSAATTTQLAAVCDEGVYAGTPGVHVYLSSDGGADFGRVATTLPVSDADSIALSTSGTIVVGGEASQMGELVASYNGGTNWSTVYRGAQSIVDGELGFTTATQGVAIVTTGASSKLLMTFDGGHHWNAVSF